MDTDSSDMIDRWNEVITRGNTEFSLQYFDNAIVFYNEALNVARHEFSTVAKASCGRAVSQVVICHFNLADCYIALRQYERACEAYFHALEFLCNLECGTALKPCVLEEAVDHAMGHVNSVWQQFLQQCGQHVSHEWQRKFQYTAAKRFFGIPAGTVLH